MENYPILILDGSKLNKEKLVSCYLKKKNISFEKREEYDNMPDDTLNDIITQEFEVKGALTHETLQKAKKVDDVPLEKDEQKAFVKWLKENNILHYANGLGINFGAVDYKYLNSLKAQGWYVGIPDMTILTGNGKTAFVELKRLKGGRVSPEQEKWIKCLNDRGYPSKVCKGCNEAIEFIKEVMNEI